ncbi:hypothetical protein MBLNU459_g1629t1 [Dothideomycetes sp. NU459]
MKDGRFKDKLMMKTQKMMTNTIAYTVLTDKHLKQRHLQKPEKHRTRQQVQVGPSNGSRDGRTPSPMIPPNATFPDPRHSLDCPFEYYSDSFFYKFESPQNFQFVELLEESTHLSGGIGGQVRITSPLEGQTAAIVVGLGIATTAPWYVSQVNIKQGPESLYLKAPTLLKKGRASARKPCMGIYVTIFVRPDIKLSSFEIATENLDLTVEAAAFDISQRHDADEIYISNTTDFTVLSGDVSVAYWASRETRIDVTSGSVSGHYALYDLLSVKTRSGSISISVEPKPADKTSPHSADFTASSMSGSVSVHFQTGRFEDEIPDREYRTHVETKSGSISGFYIHGLSSTFRTMSSSIQVKLLPYTPDAYASTLRTETNSGHTHVELLPSYKQPEIPIARMHSVHKSKSSSLSLVYPQQWVGVIDGETVSAHISLRGKDVEITKSYKGPVGTHIIAKKGSGGSRLDPGNIPTVTVPGGSAAPQSTGSIALPPGVSSLVVIALQPGAASDITPSFAGAGPATTLSVSPSPIALQSGTSLEVTPGFGATESVVVTLQPGASPESTPGVAGAQPTTASLSAAPIALKPGESSEIAPGFVGAAPTITVYPSPIALQSGASSEVTPGLVGAESTVTGVSNPPIVLHTGALSQVIPDFSAAGTVTALASATASSDSAPATGDDGAISLVAGQILTQNAQSEYIVGGQTLVPGAGVTIGTGQAAQTLTLTVDNLGSSVVLAAGTAYSIPAPAIYTPETALVIPATATAIGAAVAAIAAGGAAGAGGAPGSTRVPGATGVPAVTAAAGAAGAAGATGAAETATVVVSGTRTYALVAETASTPAESVASAIAKGLGASGSVSPTSTTLAKTSSKSGPAPTRSAASATTASTTTTTKTQKGEASSRSSRSSALAMVAFVAFALAL